MEDSLTTYHLVWRLDADDFYITRLDLEAEFFATLNTEQLISMAADVEGDTEFHDGKLPSFELITIFSGDVVFEH